MQENLNKLFPSKQPDTNSTTPLLESSVKKQFERGPFKNKYI